MTDLILIGLLTVALYFNENMRPATVAYALCVIYQLTLFDSHSAVINHVVYGLIFIPCIYFATINLASAMLAYSSFHLVVSIDYFLYPNYETMLSSNYNVIQIVLALSLIYAGIKAVDNGTTNSNRHPWNNRLSVDNLWHIQLHQKKKGRA